MIDHIKSVTGITESKLLSESWLLSHSQMYKYKSTQFVWEVFNKSGKKVYRLLERKGMIVNSKCTYMSAYTIYELNNIRPAYIIIDNIKYYFSKNYCDGVYYCQYFADNKVAYQVTASTEINCMALICSQVLRNE